MIEGRGRAELEGEDSSGGGHNREGDNGAGPVEEPPLAAGRRRSGEARASEAMGELPGSAEEGLGGVRGGEAREPGGKEPHRMAAVLRESWQEAATELHSDRGEIIRRTPSTTSDVGKADKGPFQIK